jgi:hypothetical protein
LGDAVRETCRRLPGAEHLSYPVFKKVPKALWRDAAERLRQEVFGKRAVLGLFNKSDVFTSIGIETLQKAGWRRLFNPNRLPDSSSAYLWIRRQGLEIFLESLITIPSRPLNDPEPRWVSAVELLNKAQKGPTLGNGKKALPPKRKVRNPNATYILPAAIFISLKAVGILGKDACEATGIKMSTYNRIANGISDEIGLNDDQASRLVEFAAVRKREIDKAMAALARFGLVPKGT